MMLGKTVNTRIHYGWVIVACSFFLTMTYGAFVSFGVFLKPFTAEFGWSNAAVSAAFSIHIALASISTILFGKLLDRYGARATVGLGGALMIAGFALTSQADSLWELYLFFGLVASAGAGICYVPPIAVITKWFEQRRGLAIGIAANGYSVGILYMPIILEYLISQFDWRFAFLSLAVIILALVCFGVSFLEGSPEKLGLKPYGFSEVGNLKNHINVNPERRETPPRFSDISRSRSFILLLTIYVCQYAVYAMVIVHLVAFAIDIGTPATLAAGMLSFLGIGGIIGKVTSGLLSDKIGRVKILILLSVLQGLALVAIIPQPMIFILYIIAFFFGFAIDGSWIQLPALCREFYGSVSVGLIFGVIEGITYGFGGGFGTALAGVIRDLFNSYTWAFVIAACLTFLSAVLAVSLKPPKVAFLDND